MKIEIGFSSSSMIGSRLIRWFTNSQWSHCFLVVANIYGHKIIGEAKPPRIRLIHLNEFLSHVNHYELLRIEVDEGLHICAMNKIIELTGKKYGYFQLIGYIWPWIMNKLGLKRINPFIDDYVCSEYVGFYLKEVGLLKNVDENQLTPNDIYERLKWKE